MSLTINRLVSLKRAENCFQPQNMPSRYIYNIYILYIYYKVERLKRGRPRLKEKGKINFLEKLNPKLSTFQPYITFLKKVISRYIQESFFMVENFVQPFFNPTIIFNLEYGDDKNEY